MAQNNTIHSIKNEIKSNLSVSIPLVSSQMIYACSGFLGTAMVAQLGQDALAASVLVSMLWMSLSVFFFGILNSVSVLISHQYGAKNYKAISQIMGQSFILGIILVVIMIGVLSTVPLFLHLTTQPAHVLKLSIEYMHALLWTIPGLVLVIICEQFLAGINHAKLVLRISMIIVPLEVALIYMLVFGKFGLPACGVAGIGYGFSITYTSVAVSMLVYLARSKKYAKFAIVENFNKFDWHWLRELIVVGMPMGFMHVIEVSSFAVATFWIARFGTTILAAHQIVMQYLGFAINLVFAMSQAVTIRVGHAVGAQDVSGIKLAIYTGMLLNLASILLVILLFLFAPEFILSLDLKISDPKTAVLLHDSIMLLKIVSVLILFDNFRIIGFGALRGLKDTKFPMYASLVAFWLIGLPVAFSLAFLLGLGGRGIWWGLTVGIICGAIILLIRLNIRLKNVDAKKIMYNSKSYSG